MKKLFTFLCAVLMSCTFVFAQDNLNVTGDFNGWNNADVNYQMTPMAEVENVYTLTKTFPAGTHEFKIFFSGTYDGAVAGNNSSFTLEEESDVTFYARVDGERIYFTCDKQDFYIIGDAVKGWDLPDGLVKMEQSGNCFYYADTLEVAEYAFKIVTQNTVTGDIAWENIINGDIAITKRDKYKVTLDLTTASFCIGVVSSGGSGGGGGTGGTTTIQLAGESYIEMGPATDETVWYNGSGTTKEASFANAKPKLKKKELWVGGEMLVKPEVDTLLSVKMKIQVGALEVITVDLKKVEDVDGVGSLWRTDNLTNILVDLSDDDFKKGASIKIDFSVDVLAPKKQLRSLGSCCENNGIENKLIILGFSESNGMSFEFDDTVGVDQITNDGIICYGVENGININVDTPSNIEVKSLTGQLIHKHRVDNAATIKNIQSGIYLVKINSQVYKVFVK